MSLENLGSKVVKDAIEAAALQAKKITTKVETEVTIKTTVTHEETFINEVVQKADKVDLSKLKQGNVGEHMQLFNEALETQNTNISEQATKLVNSVNNYAEFFTTWDGKSNQANLKGFVDKMMENPIAKDNVVMGALKSVSDKIDKLSSSSVGNSFLYSAADFIKDKRIDASNNMNSLNELLEKTLKRMDELLVKKMDGVVIKTPPVDKNVVLRSFAETALNSDVISKGEKDVLKSYLEQSNMFDSYDNVNKKIIEGFKEAANQENLGKIQPNAGASVKYVEAKEKQNANISEQATKLVDFANNYADLYHNAWDYKGNQVKLKSYINNMLENPIAKDNVLMEALNSVTDKTDKLSGSSAGSSFMYGAADFIKGKRIDASNNVKSLTELLEKSLKVMDVYKVKGVMEVDKNIVIKSFAETALKSDAISPKAKEVIKDHLNQSNDYISYENSNKIMLIGFKKATEI